MPCIEAVLVQSSQGDVVYELTGRMLQRFRF